MGYCTNFRCPLDRVSRYFKYIWNWGPRIFGCWNASRKSTLPLLLERVWQARFPNENHTYYNKGGPILIMLEMQDVPLQRFFYVCGIQKKTCVAVWLLSVTVWLHPPPIWPPFHSITFKLCTKTIYIWLSQVVVDDYRDKRLTHGKFATSLWHSYNWNGGRHQKRIRDQPAHLQHWLAREIVPECNKTAVRWHRPLPRCVPDLEEPGLNDGY